MTPAERRWVNERIAARGKAKVKEIIEPFLEKYPEAEAGPAHVVVSDYNLEDDLILSALRDVTDEIIRNGLSKERAETIVVLGNLLSLSEFQRTAWYAEEGNE